MINYLMAYRRSYRRKMVRRRMSRKKRFFRGKRPLGRFRNLYDSSTKVKFVFRKELIVTEPNGIGSMVVHWANQALMPAVSNMTLGECAEKERYFDLYQSFKVIGCKI